MPEPLKNMVDHAALGRIAARFAAVAPGFPVDSFVNDLSSDIETLELKERIAAIAGRLRGELPPSYPEAVQIVVAASQEPEPDAGTFDAWPFCTFVELFGTGHPDESLDAMQYLTVGFSCEFAIRPFLLDHREATFRRLRTWVGHPHEQVRRLVSEGTRPRLPWGMRVPALIADPQPGLDLIEPLHRDDSESVRRSVANHLNDVSKDHPDEAIAAARRFGPTGTAGSDALVKHALRTLVKRGDPAALELLGFTTDPQVAVESFTVRPDRIQLRDTVELAATLHSTSANSQKLVVDYAVHHVKANGTATAKTFKWAVVELAPDESRSLRKSHAVRPITTRRYHPGRHRVEMLVAGSPLAGAGFDLDV